MKAKHVCDDSSFCKYCGCKHLLVLIVFFCIAKNSFIQLLFRLLIICDPPWENREKSERMGSLK